MKLGFGISVCSGGSKPPAPVAVGVAPSSGTTAGGTHVVIEVANSALVTSAAVGGANVTGFTRDDATHVSGDAAAHAAGAVDVSVTGPGGTSTLVGAYTYAVPFDPAALNFTYWMGPDYAGLTRAGIASAGTSGTVSEAASTYGSSTAPVAGRTLNSKVSERYTSGAKGASASSTASRITSTTATIFCVFYAESSEAGGGATPYTEQTLWGEGDGYGVQLTYSNDGVKFSAFNGVGWTSFAVACSTGAWHSVVARVNGATLDIFVDGVKHTYGGTFPTMSTRGKTSVGGLVYDGASTTDLNSMELAVTPDVISDGNIGLWHTSYLHSKYGSPF